MAWVTSTDKPKTHYGNDNRKYQFSPITEGKGSKEKYFLLVNKETGVTEVWNEEVGQDRAVGTYDPKTKTFTPEPTAGWLGKGSRKYEQEFFTSEEGIESIINQGENVVAKEVYNDIDSNEVSAENRLQAGETKGKELMNTGESTIDETDTESLQDLAEDQRKSFMETKGRETWPDLRYPKNMSEDQDAIKFTIRDWAPREWDKDQPGVLKERDRSNAALLKFNMGSVVLPMPGGIKDTNKSSWGSAKLNPLEAVGAQLALAAFESTNAAGSLIKNVVNDMGASDMESTAQTLIADQVAGAGGQLMKRQGALINPNVELLFDKPELREFQFTFNLSPRNSKEAQEIIQIIRLFKQSSAPRRTVKGYFLRTPLIYQLSYINNAYNLNRFKECALTSFSTDYTPNGNYSTFRDGTMTQYKISMAFKELDPIFNDDYSALDDGEFDFTSNKNNKSQIGPLANPNTSDSAGIGY